MNIDQFLAASRSLPGSVWLYHAAQLRDFASYVEAGRVLTRRELFALDADRYTPFESDAFDIGHGSADDVFGNVVDGATFSSRGHALPNVYGCITIVFLPDAARDPDGAAEIFVRQGGIWSANAQTREPVEDAAALEALLRSGKGSQEFQLRSATLRLEDLAYVLVDPIAVYGARLADVVGAGLARIFPYGVGNRVIERSLRPNWAPTYAMLAEWAAHAPTHGGAASTLPPDLEMWFDGLNGAKKNDNLRRFANYLSHGTLTAMRWTSGHLVPIEQENDPGDAEYASDLGVYDPHELSDSEVAERAARADAVQSAETRLAYAWAWGERNEQEEAWSGYLRALEMLNRWIAAVRSRILGDAEAMRNADQEAHDSQEHHDLTNWAGRFVDIEVPNPGLPHDRLPRVAWRDVLDYPHYD